MADAALEVLVVGAGPTGLTLGCELLSRGVRVRLLDQEPVRSNHSRALAVQARTLEIFQRMGIADELVARGNKTVEVRAHFGRGAPFRFPLGELDRSDTPFPFLLFVSQAETEAVLLQRFTSLGGVVERPLKLVSFTQDAEGVLAQVQRGAEPPEPIRARYLVGGDGAHSVVRKQAGLTFHGGAYAQRFLLADVELDWSEERALHFFLGGNGMLVIFPLREGVRVLVTGGPTDPAGKATEATSESPLTLEQIQAVFDQLSKVKGRLHSPRWLTRFHLHHRAVDRYRVGRAFVAGDAAHIHSPAGGQGMNTGIQDSFNLAWKLALVLQGRASDALLDSYDAERAPVGKKLLRRTDRLFQLAAMSNPLFIGLRNWLAPMIVPLAMGNPSRRAAALRFISQLGIRYRKSPVVRDELSNLPIAPAGNRAPQGKLGDSTLFAKMAGSTAHHLLVFGAELQSDAERVARESKVPIEVIGAGDSSQLRERYGVTQGLYLIRPDGYIGWRGATAPQLEAFLSKVYK